MPPSNDGESDTLGPSVRRPANLHFSWTSLIWLSLSKYFSCLVVYNFLSSNIPLSHQTSHKWKAREVGHHKIPSRQRQMDTLWPTERKELYFSLKLLFASWPHSHNKPTDFAILLREITASGIPCTPHRCTNQLSDPSSLPVPNIIILSPQPTLFPLHDWKPCGRRVVTVREEIRARRLVLTRRVSRLSFVSIMDGSMTRVRSKTSPSPTTSRWPLTAAIITASMLPSLANRSQAHQSLPTP